MDEIIKIDFTSKIVPVKPINDQLTLCKCYVLALGKNGNRTILSKNAVDNALPTLFNIPVVGHIFVDEDGNIRMGGHDVSLNKDENGDYHFTNITIPYGTVPAQEDVHYEEVEENGAKQTYLVADIILWTGRYPELLDAKYNEDIFFSQSMEILPLETKKEGEFLDVKGFQFSALCLLGKSDDKSKNVTPCFKSARVEPYKFAEGRTWTELFAEFKEQFTKNYSAENVVKGGKMEAETIKKILLGFGMAEDTALSFEVTEGMTEDELRDKIKEVYFSAEEHEDATADETTDVAEPAAEPSDGAEAEEPASEDEPITYAIRTTYQERCDALWDALHALDAYDHASYSWYCLIDFDNEYVYVRHHFGVDGVEENKETIRIPYTLNEENKAVLATDAGEHVRLVWLTKEDEDKLADNQARYAALEKYKADRIEDDKRKSYAAILEKFSDLAEIEEYQVVMRDAMTFESEDTLTEKLYAIRGKYATGKPAKKSVDSIRIPVGFSEKKSTRKEEEDEFMARYLRKE